MSEEIIMPVKGKHFLYTTFTSSRNCAISKAAKDFFNVEFASEGISALFVNGNMYLHAAYKPDDFYRHSQEAHARGYGDKTIFELKLIQVEPNI